MSEGGVGMKKMIAILLAAALLVFAAAACSSGKGGADKEDKEKSGSSSQDKSEEAKTDGEDNEAQKAVDKLLEEEDFTGVVFSEKDGRIIAAAARGSLENGDPIKTDTPMPIGSVSKQFCAAAVLKLQEEGRLSIDDTLDKYFPEYKAGAKVTLKNLLSMRSGVPNIDEGIYSIATDDKTEEENIAAIKEWLFPQPLGFEPDKFYEYSNTNFMLLAYIIEDITGKKYIDYLREVILKPLGMEHTGDIGEMLAGAEWAGGVKYTNIDKQPGLTKGAGDIISTGEDISRWLIGLSEGRVISEESYELMTTNYSGAEGYGFGIRTEFFGGVGHPGNIGNYVAADVVFPEDGQTIFFCSNSVPVGKLSPFMSSVVAAVC